MQGIIVMINKPCLHNQNKSITYPIKKGKNLLEVSPTLLEDIHVR